MDNPILNLIGWLVLICLLFVAYGLVVFLITLLIKITAMIAVYAWHLF